MHAEHSEQCLAPAKQVVKSCEDDDDCVRLALWAVNLKPRNLPTYLELQCVRKVTPSSSG